MDLPNQIVLKVYLDRNISNVVELPINHATTFDDIIQYCKEPGEEHCHIVELWRGCERPVSNNEKPYAILKQWGVHKDEVQFYLQHDTHEIENLRRTTMFHEYDDDDDDEQTPVIGGTDMTLHELQRMAAIQQQQIDKQQHMLVAKEQRLKFLKQQDLKQQQMHAENERLYQLREKVKAQEMKLKKLRALRGQVDEKKVNNASLTCELESIKALFNEKERELSMAVSKVEELKKQLDDLRHHNQNQNPVNEKMIEFEKLKKELSIRNKLNEQQNIRLTERREMLSKRQNDISAMDQRIIELQQRLQKKRQLQQQQQQQHQQMLRQNMSAPVNMSSNVATVEPFKQGPINSFQMGDLNKNDGTEAITNKALKDKINEGSLNIYAMDQNKYSPTDGEANMSRKAYLVKQPSSGRQPYSSLVAPKGWGSSSSSKSGGVNEKNVSKSFPVYTVPSVDTDLSSIIPSRPSPAGSGDSNTSSKIDNPWKGDPIEVQQSPDSQVNTPITSASDSQKLRFAPKMITNNAHTRRLGSAAMSSYNKAMSQLYESFPSKVPEPKDQTKLPGKLPGSPTAKVQPLRIEESTDFSSETTDKYEDYPTPEFHPGGTINADKFSVKTNTLRNIRRRHSSTDSEELNKVLQARFKITEKATSQGTNSDNSNETADTNEPPALSVIDKPKRPSAPVILRKKNNAKSADRLSSRRVSFDPHALLLDASLEGELELVKKTVGEVTDPSLPNDEGITALHNAICAGHIEIVKFLVEFGCDVNAADSDGWTPLHCAASCNNLEMVKFLVEHGACIFAMTISDQETAAEKCEEDEDGFDGCSEYLYSIQEKIGILNGGAVYGLYSYHSPNNEDELVFDINDRMIVLRKVDATEKEWWWAKLKDKEGFIPRNLIGLFPRLVHQLIPT